MAFLRYTHPVRRSRLSNSFYRNSSSLAARGWSHPPSSTDAADDEVARLAASPRRTLTLADLLKYVESEGNVSISS